MLLPDTVRPSPSPRSLSHTRATVWTHLPKRWLIAPFGDFVLNSAKTATVVKLVSVHPATATFGWLILYTARFQLVRNLDQAQDGSNTRSALFTAWP